MVIDVVIYYSGGCEGNKKSPGRWFDKPARGLELVYAFSLYQIEFFRAADGRPTVIHPELAVNVFGVGTHGVEGYH